MEEYTFKSEITRLMNLLINNFYKNKEVFIRELISNSSDALDKLQDTNIKKEIRISTDPDKKTITIQDNGIGMTKKELIENLGTIAESGTQKFRDLSQSEQPTKHQPKQQPEESIPEQPTEQPPEKEPMIGKFGVGFYSSFLVSEKVEVISKHQDEPHPWMWTSTGAGSFTITPNTNTKTKNDEEIPSGTTIILYLKEDSQQFINSSILTLAIEKHSNFIPYPIYFKLIKEDGTHEWRLINAQDILKKYPEEITLDEYMSYYSFINEQDLHPPLTFKHFKPRNNPFNINLLFYVPKKIPYDTYSGMKNIKTFKLYINRVFVSDDGNLLIPPWLNFIRGIIECNNIPINATRDSWSETDIFPQIKQIIAHHALELFHKMREEDPEMFKTFYHQYGTILKWGAATDPTNRPSILALAEWQTNLSAQRINFDEYHQSMQPNQEYVYYITTSSIKEAELSPFLEGFTQNKIQVFYFSEPVDETLRQMINGYQDKKLLDITKEGVTVPTPTQTTDQTPTDQISTKTDQTPTKTDQTTTDQLDQLINRFKEVLGDKIEKVETTNRLVHTPIAIATTRDTWSANMLKNMKNRPLDVGKEACFKEFNSKKVLEINPHHPLIQEIQINPEKIETEKIEFMYGLACINSNFPLEDYRVITNFGYQALNQTFN